MIADFEAALAVALGSRLAVPFRGNVDVAPHPTDGPAIRVAVERAEVQRPDFGERRDESVLPGGGRQRVVRAVCSVSLEVVPGDGEGREQQSAGIDGALYALDAPEFRDGSALIADGDQGFRILSMSVDNAQIAIDPTRPAAAPVSLSLTAEGWFWPVGTPAQQGVTIGEVRVRGATMPLQVVLPETPLVAGAGASTLSVRVRVPASMRITSGAVATLPFETIALSLERPGGRPGAGTLGGGAAGNPGIIAAPFADGAATFTYTPPAQPDVDTLLVGMGDNSGGLGAVIGRFTLRTQAA